MKNYPKIKDITKCEDEPIHLIPKIQSHGLLVVIDKNLKIIQISTNCIDFLNINYQTAIEKNIGEFLCKDSVNQLKLWLKALNNFEAFEISLSGKKYTVIPHTTNNNLIVLDIEPTEDVLWNPINFQRRIVSDIRNLAESTNTIDLAERITKIFKHNFNYDRVMLYKFDDNWNGQIIAESKNENLTSWLGINYPATDIPENARKLFLKQGVRIISNVFSEDAPIYPEVNPISDSLLNVGQSQLRAASPFHIQYLKNMEVYATLTCAIVDQNNKLWGLVACHNYSPKFLDYQKRVTCGFLTELISNQIHLKNADVEIDKINKSSKIRLQLVKNISANYNLQEGLTKFEDNALHLINASGFIINYNNEISGIGNYPEKDLVNLISKKFNNICHTNNTNFIATNNLSDVLGTDVNKNFCGVLFYKISNKNDEFIMWFRPEQIDTKIWGGDISKLNLEKEDNKILSPRKSFEKWSETVENTSINWSSHEISAAHALVNDIKNIIVTRFAEITQLNNQLQNLNAELESFSYSVSHDLRGPLRGIDGFAHILKEDYYNLLDDFGKESIETIIQSADKMNNLMDDILSYSGLSKIDKIDNDVNLNNLIKEVCKDNNFDKNYPNTTLKVNPNLPLLYGDKVMIYQLITNLLTNAFKYSSKVIKPVVEIDFYNDGEKNIYCIADNGIGFKNEYAKKIFGVFTRLVNKEFNGTGVGLAIAQRIVYRHNGSIWAESKLGNGAKFNFYFLNS